MSANTLQGRTVWIAERPEETLGWAGEDTSAESCESFAAAFRQAAAIEAAEMGCEIEVLITDDDSRRDEWIAFNSADVLDTTEGESLYVRVWQAIQDRCVLDEPTRHATWTLRTATAHA